MYKKKSEDRTNTVDDLSDLCVIEAGAGQHPVGDH